MGPYKIFKKWTPKLHIGVMFSLLLEMKFHLLYYEKLQLCLDGFYLLEDFTHFDLFEI